MIDFDLVVFGFQVAMVLITFFFKERLGKVLSSVLFLINLLGLLMGLYTLVKEGIL